MSVEERSFVEGWMRMDSAASPEMRPIPFVIHVGGNSDPVMESFAVTNHSKAGMRMFWVFREGQPNFYSARTLVDSVANGIGNKLDQVMALWSLFPRFYTNFYPQFHGGLLDEPGTLLAAVGAAQCNHACAALELLCQLMDCDTRAIGVEARSEEGRRLAHRTIEVRVGDRWVYLDPDGHVFYRSSDGKSVAGVEELLANPWLVERTFHAVYPGDLVARAFREGGVRVYGSSLQDAGCLRFKEREINPDRRSVNRHLMRYNLLPGTAHVLTWHQGPWFSYRYGPTRSAPPFSSSGKSIVDVLAALTAGTAEGLLLVNASVEKLYGDVTLRRKDPALAGHIVVPVSSPFLAAGGRIVVEPSVSLADPPFFFNAGARHLPVDVGRNWTKVHVHSAPEREKVWEVSLDAYLDQPTFCYFIKIVIPPQGLRLRQLLIETDLQLASRALPRLHVGKNRLFYYTPANKAAPDVRVTYTSTATGKRAVAKCGNGVTIAFNFKENANRPPVLARASSELRGDAHLAWNYRDPDGDAVSAYHIRLSTRRDFLWPLAPNFDREIKSTRMVVDCGWLVPGMRYYWQVRACDEKGNWSRFCPPRTFVFPNPNDRESSCYPGEIAITVNNSPISDSMKVRVKNPSAR